MNVNSSVHVCHICGDNSFTKELDLKIHRCLRHGEKKYKCEFCDSSFHMQCKLTSHSKKHNADAKKYLCEQCGLRFISKSRLNQHSTVHATETQFKCLECGLKFRRSQAVYLHRKRVHTRKYSHKCDVCVASFKRKASLIAHKAVHSGEIPFSCAQCGNGYLYEWDLRKHVAKVHVNGCNSLKIAVQDDGGDNNKKLESCDDGDKLGGKNSLCDASLRSVSLQSDQCIKIKSEPEGNDLDGSVQGHLTKSYVDSNCNDLSDRLSGSSQCNETWPDGTDGATSTGSSSPFENKPNIEICESDTHALAVNGLSRRNTSNVDLKRSENGTSACEKMSDNGKFCHFDNSEPCKPNVEASNHTDVSVDVKPVICLKCNVALPDQFCLENHVCAILGIENTAGDFEVPQVLPNDDTNNGLCFNGKKEETSPFSKKQREEKRALSSQSSKPKFQCSECSSSFARKFNLKMHSQFHSGVTPYKCSECGGAFTSIGAFKMHCRVHNSKSIQCDDCGILLTSKYSLKKHQRSRHRNHVSASDGGGGPTLRSNHLGTENESQSKLKLEFSRVGI